MTLALLIWARAYHAQRDAKWLVGLALASTTPVIYLAIRARAAIPTWNRITGDDLLTGHLRWTDTWLAAALARNGVMRLVSVTIPPAVTAMGALLLAWWRPAPNQGGTAP